MGARYSPDTQTYFAAYDPVAGICSGLGYSHALQDEMAVSNVNFANDNVTVCTSVQDNLNTPILDAYWWVPGHLMYPKILKRHADAFGQTAPVKASDDDLNR